ncbi:MAG: hypothetical protein QOJ64_3444 [Acidobacteriota bacterium]|jgi:hypothetical protein|nr:hypothetical protein [Acidobacteriota bacterium]
MEKRWLIAAALLAGAACAQTTTKDIQRNKNDNGSTAGTPAAANSTSRTQKFAQDNSGEDDTLTSKDCGTKREGHAP